MDIVNKSISSDIAEYDGHKIYYEDLEQRVNDLIKNYFKFDSRSEKEQEKIRQDYHNLAQKELNEQRFLNWPCADRIPTLMAARLKEELLMNEMNDSYGMADKIRKAREKYYNFLSENNLSHKDIK